MRFFHGDTGGVPYTRTEITDDNIEHYHRKYMIWEWEVAAIRYGTAKLAKALKTALMQVGHAVEVRVGTRHYPASIAVEQLSKQAKAGETFDAKVLAGELIAIGETLDPLRKTIDEISVRLRALGIAITMKGGGQ